MIADAHMKRIADLTAQQALPGEPPQKLSAAQIDLLVKQAEQRESISIDQEDAQIDVGLIKRGKASPEERALRIRQRGELALLEMNTQNQMIALAEDAESRRRALLSRHAAEQEEFVANQKATKQ